MKDRSILALKPADTPDYMIDAWLSCIHWAIGRDDIVARFRAETNNNWIPGATPLDHMIDEATGADWEFIKAFILWVNQNLW